MKIFHIVPDVSYDANGVTPVIDGLSSFSTQNGDQVSVCSLDAKISDPRIEFLKASRSSLFNLNEYSADFSKFLKWGFEKCDIVHGHSLWSSANLLTGIYAKHRKAKLVTSPHGTLTGYALSRRRILKKMLWPVQRLALTRADLLHATAKSEVEDIRCAGYKGPVALIPNGVEVPQLIGDVNGSRKKQVLFLSRIHPTKGIENLLRVWSSIEQNHAEWHLVITGVGAPEYEACLKEMSHSLRVQRVRWAGPMYGAEKTKLYQESSLFVLPSYSENFGMVVAEALANGCPAIVSRGAPWAALEPEGCGWWVDNSVPTLAAALDAAMQLPQGQLAAMGLRGRAWMERDFGWNAIGKKMDAAYRWLLNGGERPAWVRMD